MIEQELAEPIRKFLDCYDNNRLANLPNEYPNIVDYTFEFYEIVDHMRFSYGRYLGRVDTDKMSSREYEKYLTSKGIKRRQS